MIPCHICGKDSGAHWVTGYIPAPDSQKMALCGTHDTPENRNRLRLAWYTAMVEAIRTATQNAAYFATRGALFMLSIHYSAGGSLNLPCLEAAVTDHNTLKVTAPDGSLSFFPMQHIKRYDLTPLHQDIIS
ncbi:conserved hypothetical protein [uncultured delta proteobacterium]|uniref:Uncharacterized protein n=1 Tax=uncultured delta proteobacterium TaxID=34034 RepID=A0A212J3F8_9DELT|nr:conserved hypothetical protein [uncultured delta proteobacterium]